MWYKRTTVQMLGIAHANTGAPITNKADSMTHHIHHIRYPSGIRKDTSGQTHQWHIFGRPDFWHWRRRRGWDWGWCSYHLWRAQRPSPRPACSTAGTFAPPCRGLCWCRCHRSGSLAGLLLKLKDFLQVSFLQTVADQNINIHFKNPFA